MAPEWAVIVTPPRRVGAGIPAMGSPIMKIVESSMAMSLEKTAVKYNISVSFPFIRLFFQQGGIIPRAEEGGGHAALG